MNITVVHGFSKFPLTIENIGDSTVDDLSTELEEKSGVPKDNQKLIFKGKTLADKAQRLDTVGLKNGAKLMLIGKKFCPEEDAAFRQLEELKSQCENLKSKQAEYQADLASVSDGFLSRELVPQRLEQLRKNVLSISEQGMKLLTSIDAVRLDEDGERAESVKNEFKTKRKSLVDQVNALMDSADSLVEKVEVMKLR